MSMGTEIVKATLGSRLTLLIVRATLRAAPGRCQLENTRTIMLARWVSGLYGTDF